jgi:hypothetical protein
MKTLERLTHRASLGSAIVIYTGQYVDAGQVRLHAVIGGEGSTRSTKGGHSRRGNSRRPSRPASLPHANQRSAGPRRIRSI